MHTVFTILALIATIFCSYRAYTIREESHKVPQTGDQWLQSGGPSMVFWVIVYTVLTIIFFGLFLMLLLKHIS